MGKKSDLDSASGRKVLLKISFDYFMNLGKLSFKIWHKYSSKLYNDTQIMSKALLFCIHSHDDWCH